MPRCLAVLVAVAAAGCGTGDIVALNGEGSTFVEPILKAWANEYLDQTGDRVRVNYQGKGSGAGVTQMTRKLADFGCTDAPLNRKQLDEALATGGPVVHVPLVIGAVVPIYNLPTVDAPVTFTGPVLADVFAGKIKTWNDPRLAALNPGLRLPALDIQPVYRADPSGTSFIVSDYLAKVSPEFKKSVGASTLPKWPSGVGIAQNKTDGVAGHVARTVGAIGYVELTYALDTKARYGAVVNRAGRPVLANLDGITAAAAASLATKPTAEPYSLHDLTYNLTNAPGDASYPIAGMSFAVIYQAQPARTGPAVVEFLKWATGPDGQKLAGLRNYAPLPEALRQQVRDKLDAVRYE